MVYAPLSLEVAQRLSVRQAQVEERVQQLRAQAAGLTDEHLQQRLGALCERLEALRDKLAAMLQGH
jgi:hypothetical protein